VLVVAVLPRDGVRERLIIELLLTRGDGSRLSVRLGDELGSPHIGHPELHGSKSLPPEPVSVLTDTLTGGGYVLVLHVTLERGSA